MLVINLLIENALGRRNECGANRKHFIRYILLIKISETSFSRLDAFVPVIYSLAVEVDRIALAALAALAALPPHAAAERVRYKYDLFKHGALVAYCCSNLFGNSR